MSLHTGGSQNVEIDQQSYGKGSAASLENQSVDVDVNMEAEEEDEEEEEDVDFNPFMRGETHSEASSSLSSENERPGEHVGRSLRCSSDCQNASTSPRRTDEVQSCSNDSSNEDEGIVLQTKDSVQLKRNKVELQSNAQQLEGLACPEETRKELSCINASHAADDLAKADLLEKTLSPPNRRSSQQPIVETADEDAICRRTRARHSLAHYTLEELETFLQESDDEGDLQNVDDEEEYRKFLAVVLLEGDSGQSSLTNENLDEDEENDADFEIEIEEALESDVDEATNNNQGHKIREEEDSHRPETRQKKRLKESSKNKKCLLGQAKLPLRPILPYVPDALKAPFPSSGWQYPSLNRSHCTLSLPATDLINGFTTHQIGQLYCLIHEHVQLLIQIFSVCILDPSKQQVATEFQKMILEMVDNREEALSRRTIPFPECCFESLHLRSSLSFDTSQTAECSSWKPLMDKPVQSVLDVAPLSLLRSYMSDVSATVLRYRQSQVEGTVGTNYLKREPLFPSPPFASPSESSNEVWDHSRTTVLNTASPNQVKPKKSLAATLVENTKKRPVTLVPMDIAKLAQRFYPLLNAALFPHKPPVPAVANRILFTDAEDRLLAMGIMEYNNDWVAIRQRYLPCKTKHQIFVRQKNRSSSKAPENPIKAVRRMKTSPLTADEMARVCEGLKIFKQDWFSVWKFCVPHRDPSLLPRQWRAAIGTQKSYRTSEANKEKRRLYEAKRRKVKGPVTDWQSSSGQEVDDGGCNPACDMDDQDEAYVHEAFLADSQPGGSKHKPSDISLSSVSRKVLTTDMIPNENTFITENSAVVPQENRGSKQKTGAVQELVAPTKSMEDMNSFHLSHVRYGAPCSASSSKLPPRLIARPSSVQFSSLPYRRRRANRVQLAPDLPPVNLPKSVRVISQSSFSNYQNRPSCSKTNGDATGSPSPGGPRVVRGTSLENPGNHKSVPSDSSPALRCSQNGNISTSQHVLHEKSSESDIHMHPLLFHTPNDQFSSYYVMNYNTTASTYNFFPGNPLHSEYDLTDPRHSLGTTDRRDITIHAQEASTNLHTIDFHPLLQRNGNANGVSTVVSSVDSLRKDSETLQSNYGQFLNVSDCILRKSSDEDPQLAINVASLSHREKENELDLDIRLYSTCGKEKASARKDIRKHHNGESIIHTLNHSAVSKGKHDKMQFYDNMDKCSEVVGSSNSDFHSRACNNKTVGSLTLGPKDNSSACQRREGGFANEWIPDIIMEQEELSDSDEEGEHVEFECEEIDDSEQEETDNRHPAEIHNEEIEHVGLNGIQADLDLNRMHQSVSPNQGRLRKEKNKANHMQLFPGSSSDVLPHIKRKCERVKKDRPCKSSQNELHPHPSRTSTTRTGESSKTSRKPRKRSL